MERLEGRLLLAHVPLPTVVDPNLEVQAVVEGLTTPTTMAFLPENVLPELENELFILEKNTGQVKLVANGAVQSTVLDLAVNFASERGLLGIALHPEFGQDDSPYAGSVYLYWTESATGDDTGVLGQTPLLGNRVDRFVWNGSTLEQAENIIRLRALQPVGPGEEREFGNHDGGVILFGPDGKLYVIIGDTGRRGQMQNLPDGPFASDDPNFTNDDAFGGPEPDDAHLTGVILRLNDNGSAPQDNPFFDVGAELIAQGEAANDELLVEVGENLQLVFAYGVRNSFGMAVDPLSGKLWHQDNGDDSFDELNLVEPGANLGWIQIMGPVERIEQFKAIETGQILERFRGLQQQRWSPDNIADSPEEALSRLLMLPGAHYSDPEFSWKFAVAPAGIGFLDSRALGPQYFGDLFVGASRDFLEGGYLFHFNLTGNRRKIGVDDPRLRDRVADNNPSTGPEKGDLTESESLLFGRGFGIGTDIRTGPDGNLYVVSLDHGAVYQISRRERPVDEREARRFEATLSGDEEVPPVETDAHGFARFHVNRDETRLRYHLNVFDVENVTQAHMHIGPPGENGPVIAFLFGPEPGGVDRNGNLAKGTLTEEDLIERPGVFDGTFETLLAEMRAGNTYVNVHTIQNPGGEIRGQIMPDARPAEDANRDGRVNLGDLLDVVGHLREKRPHGPASRFFDANVDGEVTIGDLVSIVARLRADLETGPRQPGKGNGASGRAHAGPFAFLISDENQDEDHDPLSNLAFLEDLTKRRSK